jgi:UDP-2,3-diacylglucosamine pyrophosphatase LpxH
MLVVLSDLHFVDGTAGKHNLPAKAFQRVFLSSILSLAEKNQATEVKLLLLGDIPDLIRSTLWLAVPPEDRPWGKNGLSDIPIPRPGSATEKHCLDILGCFPASGLKSDVPENTILYQNWDTFAFFRDLPAQLQVRLGPIPVQIIYIVGNHDRLINLYPSLRDQLRQMLGLTVSADTVDIYDGLEWWYRYTYVDREYGVFARHGHQFDVYNYNGSQARRRLDHLQVPIGDVITTEFAVNLPYTLQKLRAKYPAVTDDMVRAIEDVDNVRPLGRILEWFYFKMKEVDNDQVLKALDETLDSVINHMLDVKFVQEWQNAYTRFDELLRMASRPPFNQLIEKVTQHTRSESLLSLLLPSIEKRLNTDHSLDEYTQGAYLEEEWRRPKSVTQFVLYGHTHTPVLRPLNSINGRDILYFNTGTWRNRIYRTISLDAIADFVDVKQLTFLVFYNAEEDVDDKEPGTLGFESWVGNHKKEYLKDMAKERAFLTSKEED